MNRQEIANLYPEKFVCNFLLKLTSNVKKILKISKQNDQLMKATLLDLDFSRNIQS